jgi:hypothetical protein
MSHRRFITLGAMLFVATALFAAATAPSHAIGYYNLPGSFCQCFGYGNGAGHHACLVLGPISCQGFCATKEVRLECPPRPAYSCYGCGDCGVPEAGSWLNDPTLAPQPQPAPTPAAMRPQILR